MNKSPTKSYWGQIHSRTLFIAALWMLVLVLFLPAHGFEPNSSWHKRQHHQPTVAFKTYSPASDLATHSSFKGALYRNRDTSVSKMLVKTEAKPQIVPYNWNAEYKNGQLVISGHVPMQSDRDAIIEVAKAEFARSSIVDKMLVGKGEPHDWLATVTLAIRQLAKLKEGKVLLEDTKLTITGIAQHQKTAEDIRISLRTRQAALYTIQQDIKFLEAKRSVVEPFKSTITYKNKSFRLLGLAPSQVKLDQIIKVIETELPRAAIVNRMTITAGATEDWLNCTLAGLNSLIQLDEGKLEVVDSELSLTGLTRDEEIGELIPKQLRAAVNRSCKETVKLYVDVPPEPNLDWRALHRNDTLLIEGEVPNSAIQDDLVESASKLFPNSKISVNMRVNPGRSEKWAQVAKIGLQLLAKLRNGEARLIAQTLTLIGEAEDTAADTAIRQQLKAGIAKGYHAVAQIEVKSAAMLWSEREARRNEKNAAEQAENQVPTASQPQQTKGTAPSSRPEMETQQGETENFARQPPAPKSEQIKATPIQSQPLQAERQRCQEALDEIMRTGTISFPAGSDKFNSDSLATLQRLTDIRDLCEGRIVIEIAGHTDSLGSASRNQDLSQRRAQMVRSYLIEQGMSAAQLSTRGYGEERPLVPNTTSDNRARNRRIEFHAIIN